jgi:hypothetical protein
MYRVRIYGRSELLEMGSGYVIYFAKCCDFIKIGYTSDDAESRVKNLQTGCPFKISLIGAIDGDRSAENTLHGILAAHHYRGEWFRESDELSEIIETLFEDGLTDGLTAVRRLALRPVVPAVDLLLLRAAAVEGVYTDG